MILYNTNNNAANVPILVSLRASNQNIVLGCPGVPRSIPRIESVLEIRSRDGSPFYVKSVGVELRTTQEVSVPATLGSNDSSVDYKVYEDPFLFMPAVGEFQEEAIALDIPFIIPLPKDITASGKFPHWNASTINKLVFKINYGTKGEGIQESFPVSIKRYDTLPLYRQYNEPISETNSTVDSQVIIDLSMPYSSVGPRDLFTVYLKIMANSLNKNLSRKLKLKKVIYEIKEILECHEGGLPAKKEHIIYTSIEDFNEIALTSNGIATQLDLEYPVENDFLKSYSGVKFHRMTESNSYTMDDDNSMVATNTVTHEKLAEGIPVTHSQGFTTWGKLFSIRYEVVIKIKLHRAKDTEIRVPFVVSPYDRVSCNYILNWIMNECEISKKRFGKVDINRLDQGKTDLKQYASHSTVYRYNVRDWVKLGLNEEAFGTKGKTLLQYID